MQVVDVLYPSLRQHALLPKIAQLHAVLTRGASAQQQVAGVGYRRLLTYADVC
jgi:hypothetical protein